jgi:hypothetical protein
MPRKGRRHPRSPPHSAASSFVGAAVQVLDLSPVSISRTSAVSSALAAKLVARVLRAATVVVEVGQRENSPITHRGARAALCFRASPLAAGTGDAGGSGSEHITRNSRSGVCNCFNRRIVDFDHASHVVAIRYARLPASGLPSSLATAAPNLLATSRASK